MAGNSREAVLECLWQWDPIGIGALRDEARSEYDELAARIVSTLERGGSVDAVEECARAFVADLGIEAHGIEQFVQSVRESITTN